MNFENIWLASASPRRRQILGWTGITFQSLSMDIDESIKTGENVENYVRRLAIEKARTALDRITSDGLVIAADTSVVLDNTILVNL
jgi:septum formation protein